MPVICPSILAPTPEQFRKQIEAVAGFAHRIQIDLTDGAFAKHLTVRPEAAWWPAGVKADIHLMYKDPTKVLDKVLAHRPHMVIIHAEAEGDFDNFRQTCRRRGVKVGVALLPRTSPHVLLPALPHIDHVLIFSGDLGSYGGHADLDLMHKVAYLKNQKPSLEIGWDGGVNQQNISQLAFGGVDVFDVGGFIQEAENPERAYKALERIADETGTT